MENGKSTNDIQKYKYIYDDCKIEIILYRTEYDPLGHHLDEIRHMRLYILYYISYYIRIVN